jgi:hypothetical protein
VPSHPLEDLAWKFNDLMRPSRARAWLHRQCVDFLQNGEASWQYFPIATGRFGRALTLQAKCAVLAALHEIVCTSVEPLNPAPAPPHWPADFAQGRPEQEHQAAKDAQRWAVLLDHVKNSLGSEQRDDVEAWLKDVEQAWQESGVAIRPVEATVPPSDAAKQPKRSTEPDEARNKLIATLTKHHRYAQGSCMNLEPIASNDLARKAQVGKGSASRFFKAEFKGHVKYKAVCLNASKLAVALKILNGEISPHILYGANPPGEGNREDD